MPLGERGPHERKKERGALPRYSTVIGSSSVKMVVDRNRHAAITSADDELFKNVNIDDLE